MLWAFQWLFDLERIDLQSSSDLSIQWLEPLDGWLWFLLFPLVPLLVWLIYRNEGGNDNDWLRIQVQGTVSNRDGIGTFITVDPDTDVVGDEMVREINAGSNFLGQNEFIAPIGLGPNADTLHLTTPARPSGMASAPVR